ncbi:MAG: hypothetical protein ACM359_07905 [Bacillota bacterium]
MSSSPTASKNSSVPAPVKQPSSVQRSLIIGVSVGIVVIGAIAALLWSKGSDETPRLNADTVSLAKFASTDQYTKLPFDKQRLYMKVLEDRDDNNELKKAFAAGRLTEAEYRTALQEAWLGQQLKRSERFTSLPAPARALYISELLNKKAKDKAKDNKNSSGSSKRDAADEVKRDDTLEKMRIAAWPPEVRMQWEEYRRAYEDQKNAREKAAAAAEKDKSE